MCESGASIAAFSEGTLKSYMYAPRSITDLLSYVVGYVAPKAQTVVRAARSIPPARLFSPLHFVLFLIIRHMPSPVMFQFQNVVTADQLTDR